MSVLVVGSVNRDYVCRVTSIPRPGETVVGGELSLTSGGKGGNQAVAAARMGATTTLVACVGDDTDGHALLADLAAAGVGIEDVETVDDVRSGAAFVMVADDGENSIVVAPGANGRLDAARASRAVTARVGPGDLLVLQAEIPIEAVVAAVEAAVRSSVRVVLNLAPYRPVPEGVLQVCDPLVVNEVEARALLGVGSDDVGAVEMAVTLRRRTRSVVITLGAAGAVAAYGDVVDQVPAPQVPVVDSTGAGDAFVGALAAAVSAGVDLANAVRLGVQAGSVAVGRLGAQTSFPTPDDVPPAS